ncbi:PAS domain-containing sensor histidine kinase [Halapricum salinum]|uniref:histidine kinase n=1 Tax=Halapricum salinum TaxID=1457250 RepID=A0A4D6HA50_9EURY|nr:PAS domain-containing sensor histidine kinase [Halapricum salinum]QCC50545.1 PAS domain-containing sensor histidine kinase [Halapricum salinum]
MTDGRQVFVVDGAGQSVEAFASGLQESVGDVTAESVDLDDVMVRLCRSAVDCLVVPADSTATDVSNVVYAVDGLYPELPTVVFGTDLPEVDTVAVDAATLTDATVVETVADVLDGDRPPSARQPTRRETLLAAMFEGFPAHLYAKDADARHLITSDELIAPSALLGLTDMETLSGDEMYDEANYADDWRVIGAGESVLDIDEYADSTDSFLRTSKVPWRDGSGEIVGLVGITQDMGELREQKEALRRQNRRLRKVALMTAHELRNELQVATGHLSQIECEGAAVDDTGASIERVAAIVDKIVSLATFNQRERESTTLWLSALVRDVWEAFSTPESALALADDRRLVADRDATQLLVELLIDNAIVHSGPAVTVEVGGTESGFYIADDGPGIAFDPPERALEPATTTVDSESGFGLYIAQQIADEQGWVLDVSASDAGGARFDVTGIESP